MVNGLIVSLSIEKPWNYKVASVGAASPTNIIFACGKNIIHTGPQSHRIQKLACEVELVLVLILHE